MLTFDGLLLLVLYVGAQGLTLWAFVDALIRPATGFVATGKLSKPAWVAITALAATAGDPPRLTAACPSVGGDEQPEQQVGDELRAGEHAGDHEGQAEPVAGQAVAAGDPGADATDHLVAGVPA